MLDKLPAKGVRTMLQELARAGERVRASAKGDGRVPSVPLATFHLRTGRDLRGWLLGLGEKEKDDLLIQLASQTHSRSGDVAYVSAKDVEAITIHNAAAAVEILSFGAIEAPPTSPPPGRLALKRRAQEIQTSLTAKLGAPLAFSIGWEEIATDDDSLRSLERLVEDTHLALIDVVDEFGPSSLQVDGIEVREGEACKVRRREQRLIVTAALGKGRGGRLDRPGLKQAISSIM